MMVHIIYYGPAKMWASRTEEVVTIAQSMTLSELKEWLVERHTGMKPYIQKIAFALNGKLVLGSTALKDGDEIAVLPPVSGGGKGSFSFTEKRIDLFLLLSNYLRGCCGAILPFVGVVRKREEGRLIEALEYEVYLPLARQKGNRIVEELKEEYKLEELYIVHRIGRVKPGEIATVILATAECREELFCGVRDALDRFKKELPIWKKIIFKNRKEVWRVGSPLQLSVSSVSQRQK